MPTSHIDAISLSTPQALLGCLFSTSEVERIAPLVQGKDRKAAMKAACGMTEEQLLQMPPGGGMRVVLSLCASCALAGRALRERHEQPANQCPDRAGHGRNYGQQPWAHDACLDCYGADCWQARQRELHSARVDAVKRLRLLLARYARSSRLPLPPAVASNETAQDLGKAQQQWTALTSVHALWRAQSLRGGGAAGPPAPPKWPTMGRCIPKRVRRPREQGCPVCYSWDDAAMVSLIRHDPAHGYAMGALEKKQGAGAGKGVGAAGGGKGGGAGVGGGGAAGEKKGSCAFVGAAGDIIFSVPFVLYRRYPTTLAALLNHRKDFREAIAASGAWAVEGGEGEGRYVLPSPEEFARWLGTRWCTGFPLAACNVLTALALKYLEPAGTTSLAVSRIRGDRDALLRMLLLEG